MPRGPITIRTELAGTDSEFSEEADDCFVGLAIYRGRCDLQLPGIPEAAGEFGFARAGADLSGDARFHAERFSPLDARAQVGHAGSLAA